MNMVIIMELLKKVIFKIRNWHNDKITISRFRFLNQIIESLKKGNKS